MSKILKIIAFYLPQFHPTENNNKWYGEGFTEWTNVAKAKKLFPGHEQPHIPADLGFYDLRLEETRIAQAEMAQKYGVYGFCYYHYWFAPGVTELSMPINKVLESGKPDFPFMFCWANETWQKKFWNIDGTVKKKNLQLQTYNGVEDYKKHFYDVLPFLKDKRYIKQDGKPLFMIYKPLNVPDLKVFINVWNELAIENGFDGITFIGQSVQTEREEKAILASGISSVNSVRLYDNYRNKNIISRCINKLIRIIFRIPNIKNYGKIYKTFTNENDENENIIPTIIPNWDHTPRSGRGGYVIQNSTPKLFRKHLIDVFGRLKNKKNKIVFLKSWNEWGEGNYMEPDLKYGRKYLEVLREEIDNFEGE